jgi:hypothetical protein
MNENKLSKKEGDGQEVQKRTSSLCSSTDRTTGDSHLTIEVIKEETGEQQAPVVSSCSTARQRWTACGLERMLWAIVVVILICNWRQAVLSRRHLKTALRDALGALATVEDAPGDDGNFDEVWDLVSVEDHNITSRNDTSGRGLTLVSQGSLLRGTGSVMSNYICSRHRYGTYHTTLYWTRIGSIQWDHPSCADWGGSNWVAYQHSMECTATYPRECFWREYNAGSNWYDSSAIIRVYPKGSEVTETGDTVCVGDKRSGWTCTMIDSSYWWGRRNGVNIDAPYRL